jgi:hypothetical protein
MPAAPFLEAPAVHEDLLLRHLRILLAEYYWGRHLFGQQLCEVDICEEGVLLDLLGSSARTQTFLRVDLEESIEKGFGLGGEIVGEWDWLANQILEHGALIIGEERRPASEHVVDERAEAEPVCGLRITLAKNDLWSDVLWRPTETVCLLVGRIHDLA